MEVRGLLPQHVPQIPRSGGQILQQVLSPIETSCHFFPHFNWKFLREVHIEVHIVLYRLGTHLFVVPDYPVSPACSASCPGEKHSKKQALIRSCPNHLHKLWWRKGGFFIS